MAKGLQSVKAFSSTAPEIFFLKKSHNAEKLKGGPFSLVRYCMLRGKPFWFSSLGQQVQFGVFLKFCKTFGRTISVFSGVSKFLKH